MSRLCHKCNRVLPENSYVPSAYNAPQHYRVICKPCGKVIRRKTNPLWAKKGIVYVVTNPAWGDWAKVGLTTSGISERLKAFNVSSPLRDYECYYYFNVDDIVAFEIECHEYLSSHFEQRNEWFNGTAKEIVISLLSNLENFIAKGHNMQLVIDTKELTKQQQLEIFNILGLLDIGVHENQKQLPLNDEVVIAKPIIKRKAKGVEATNTPEEVTEPTQEVKTSSVSLQEVKELAQAMVAKHDRESVKAIISVYGEKLTEVKESDYQKLFDALNALNN